MTTKAPPPAIHVTNTKLRPGQPAFEITLTPHFEYEENSSQRTTVLPGGGIFVEIVYYGETTVQTGRGSHTMRPVDINALNAGLACKFDIETVHVEDVHDTDVSGTWLLVVSGAIPVHHPTDDGHTLDTIPINSTMDIPQGMITAMLHASNTP